MRRKQFEGMVLRVNLTTMASKSSSTIDGPYGSVMGCTSTSNAGFTNCTSMKKNESISLSSLSLSLDASLDSSVNQAFLQRQCIMTWDKLEAHASHVIPHMLHLTTKPYFSQNGEIVHIDTC